MPASDPLPTPTARALPAGPPVDPLPPPCEQGASAAWIARIVVVLLFGVTVLLRGPLGQANEDRRRTDFRYTPRVEVMKIVAGAHRSSVADWFWLCALPDISPSFPDAVLAGTSPADRASFDQRRKEARRRWLSGVFDLLTSLDPTFVTVYRYGATFLGFLEENHQAAIDLLESGVRNNPDDLVLRLDVAWSHYQYRKDRKKAIEHLEVAAQNPACDAYLLRLLSWMQVNERDDVPAVMQWLQWVDSPNGAVRAKAQWCLGKTCLEIAYRAVGEFEQKSGRKPATIDELRGTDLIDGEVEEVVLQGLSLKDGKPFSAAFQELNRQRSIDLVEQWARQFRDQHDRWPALDELRASSIVRLPEPPPGQRFDLVDGKVVSRPE